MKSVFITGAGSGMGREGAKLFHAKSWRVGAVDRSADGLATLTQELGAERFWTRVVDVTDRAALDGALERFVVGEDAVQHARPSRVGQELALVADQAA